MPRLLLKLLATTLISVAVCGLGFVVYRYRLIDFDSLSAWVGIRDE